LQTIKSYALTSVITVDDQSMPSAAKWTTVFVCKPHRFTNNNPAAQPYDIK